MVAGDMAAWGMGPDRRTDDELGHIAERGVEQPADRGTGVLGEPATRFGAPHEERW